MIHEFGTPGLFIFLAQNTNLITVKLLANNRIELLKIVIIYSARVMILSKLNQTANCALLKQIQLRELTVPCRSATRT